MAKYEIKNGLLFLDGEEVTMRKSPNHGGALHPEYIIIHYTGAATAESALSWMVAPVAKVSAHLHEDREGNTVQLVPFDVVAWHAGQSEWHGVVGLNSHSVGIELQNTGTQEYTQVQLDNLALICKAIAAVYPIKEILGHSDIAPGRKVDPGKQFPMIWLREQVFGAVAPAAAKQMKTTSDLNLRAGAGTDFKIITTLAKGTPVSILEDGGAWYKISVGRFIGYVSSKYLA